MKALLQRFVCSVAVVWIAHVVWFYFKVDQGIFKRFSPVGSLLAAIVATVLIIAFGQFLRISAFRRLWNRAGQWTLLISFLGVGLLLGDLLLGEYYGLWISWMWECGLILVGFPIYHLRKHVSPTKPN